MQSEKNNRLNEENISSKGQKMKIVGYRNVHDIDVQFEDGTIIYHQHYKYFKKGYIKNPNANTNIPSKLKNLRVNKTVTKKDGTIITCIEYINSKNITVQFPDGTIRTNVSWTNFMRGEVAKIKQMYNDKKSRINQTSTKKDGTVITCIDYTDSNNITVQFPDGTIRKNVSWNCFIKGEVAKPEKQKNTNPVNETNTATNGLKMAIIRKDPGKNPIIQFEDGYTIQRSYHNFQRGWIEHNTLKAYNSLTGHVKGTLYNTSISGIAHNYKNTTHYFCECKICKTREIWNFEQIKNHECNNQIANKNQHTGTDNV